MINPNDESDETKMAVKPTATTKAVNTLRAGLKKLEDHQLACRDMRHAWAVEQDYHVEAGQSVGKKIQSIKRVLVCMRGCETRRVEHYHATKYGLDKVAQHYDYPDGYQIPGVPRGVKPSVVIQQESYRRAMEKIANAAKGETETAEK